MKSEIAFENQQSYMNPVLDRPCADPFVLKHLNEYWCYSTGIQPDERSFGAFILATLFTGALWAE